MAQKKSSVSNTKIVSLVITLSAVMAVLAIVFRAVYDGDAAGRKRSNVDVPVVSSSMTSSGDGKVHNVQTKFTVQVDDRIRSQVDGAKLQKQIEEIMSGLDYAKVSGEDNIKYVKNQVMAGLAAYMNADMLKGIYITDIGSGGASSEYGNPVSDSLNQVMKSLSEKLK